MARSRLKTKGRRDYKPFKSMPTECMKSEKYIQLSPYAKVLLWEFCYQYNGYNNGDLCAAYDSVLKKRGFRSKGTVARALKELRKADWIIVSRQGGINRCSLYALTFNAVDECQGKLDINSTIAPSHGWKN